MASALTRHGLTVDSALNEDDHLNNVLAKIDSLPQEQLLDDLFGLKSTIAEKTALDLLGELLVWDDTFRSHSPRFGDVKNIIMNSNDYELQCAALQALKFYDLPLISAKYSKELEELLEKIVHMIGRSWYENANFLGINPPPLHPRLSETYRLDMLALEFYFCVIEVELTAPPLQLPNFSSQNKIPQTPVEKTDSEHSQMTELLPVCMRMLKSHKESTRRFGIQMWLGWAGYAATKKLSGDYGTVARSYLEETLLEVSKSEFNDIQQASKIATSYLSRVGRSSTSGDELEKDSPGLLAEGMDPLFQTTVEVTKKHPGVGSTPLYIPREPRSRSVVQGSPRPTNLSEIY